MRQHGVPDLGPLFGEPAPINSSRTDSALIDRPNWVTKWASLTEEQREQQRERWRGQLLPIVMEFCESRGPEGFTASDVISRGITDSILNGERSFLKANPRIYSFLGPWLAALSRARTIAPKVERLASGGLIHLKAKSERVGSHGNEGYRYIGRRWAA